MAYADILLRQAVADPSSWATPSGALIDDTDYAVSGSGLNIGLLKVFNVPLTALPKDITINGVEIMSKAMLASSTVGATLSAWFSYDGTTQISSTKATSALTTTETAFWFGSATDLWGLSKIKRPKIDGNTTFTVALQPTGNPALVKVNVVMLRVHYTAGTSLLGERSDFPDSLDTITKAQNGVGPENVVTSEALNTLGDALFNIETHILTGQQNTVKAFGYPPGRALAVFAITVSGVVTSSTGTMHFNLSKRAGWSSVRDANITATQGTRPPYTSIRCDFVSGVGWLVPTAGGLAVPVHITPRSFYLAKAADVRTPQSYDSVYTLGFTACGQQIYESLTAQNNDGYKGIYLEPKAIPNGTLIVKLLAIGHIT